MDTNDLVRQVCETNFDYLALGNNTFEAHGASFIRNDQTPRRHDSNGVGLVRTESFNELELLLQRAELEYEPFSHRAFYIDALTPLQSEARIALEPDYKISFTLVHVLEGELHQRPRTEIELREVLTEEDWTAYRELDRNWWEETSTGILGTHHSSLHDEFMLNTRIKTPQVRSWFACLDGTPRAFFSSWPGENGIGMVEDLYCHPEYRHRGLATTLIAHCVADARERGAGPVIINSDVNDTPKQMYAAMGFRPLYVARVYTKKLDEKKDAP